MNCRRIEELIPLHVESDLDSHRNDAVVSHLGACDRCNRLAREYEESQAWLRSYVAPSFDVAFFEGLKGSVLHEIERAGSQRTLLQAIAQSWNRMPVLAAAVTVLLGLGGLAVYFYHGSAKTNPDPRQTVARDSNEKEPRPVGKEPSEERRPRFKPAISSKHTARRNPQDRVQEEFLDNRQQDYSLEQIVASEGLPQAEGFPNPELQPVRPSGDETPPDMLRIEIQTSDPGIRIIWFVPKASDSRPAEPMENSN